MPDYQAAVALIRCADAVLLMRRAEHDNDPWSGHWALPGGKREAHDLSARHTAAREAQEEMGLSLDPARAIDLGVNPAGAHVGRPISVAVCAWDIPLRPPLTLDPAEAAGDHWLELPWFYGAQREQRELVLGQPPLPCLMVRGHPLWGFTLRVLEGRFPPKHGSDGTVLT